MYLGYFILFILIFVFNEFLFCEALKQFFFAADKFPQLSSVGSDKNIYTNILFSEFCVQIPNSFYSACVNMFLFQFS